MSDERITVFISYAREDQIERERLSKHLRQVPWFEVWDDGEIPAGSEWDDQISTALDGADIILLVVSVDFLDSKYVDKVEIPRALERHEAGTAVVIPILLKVCGWKDKGIDHLNALPASEQWVEKWDSRDEALLAIVDGVKDAAEELRAARQRRFEARETYRRKVAEALADGHISLSEQDNLTDERKELRLTEDEAKAIEAGETQTIEEKRKNREKYSDTITKHLAKGEYPFPEFDRNELKKRQNYLGLTDDDIEGLEDRAVSEWNDTNARAEREARERQEREDSERAQRERAEREQAERAQREQAERAERERAEREATERAEREQAEREATERVEREAAALAAATAEGNAEAIAWASALAYLLQGHVESFEGALSVMPNLDDDLCADGRRRCDVPDEDIVVAIARPEAGPGDTPEDAHFCAVYGLQSLYVAQGMPSETSVTNYTALPSADVFSMAIDIPTMAMYPFIASCIGLQGMVTGNELAIDAIRHDLSTRSGGLDDLEAALRQRILAEFTTRDALRQRWAPELASLLQQLSGATELFAIPNISDKKTGNAFERYGVPTGEQAIGIIDTTVFGSAKDGLMFGVEGIYLNNPYGTSPGAHSIEYDALTPFDFEINEENKNEVSIGDFYFTATNADESVAILAAVRELYFRVNLDVRRELAERDASIDRRRQLAMALQDIGLLAAVSDDESAARRHLHELLELCAELTAAEPDRVDLALDRAFALRWWAIFTGDRSRFAEAAELLDQLEPDESWREAVRDLRSQLAIDLSDG